MTEIQQRALEAMRCLTNVYELADVSALWENWICSLESDGLDNEAESVRKFVLAQLELRRESPE